MLQIALCVNESHSVLAGTHYTEQAGNRNSTKHLPPSAILCSAHQDVPAELVTLPMITIADIRDPLFGVVLVPGIVSVPIPLLVFTGMAIPLIWFQLHLGTLSLPMPPRPCQRL